MLDSDLAELYKVDTGQLNRAVRRNKDRFPEDFLFQLSNQNRALLFVPAHIGLVSLFFRAVLILPVDHLTSSQYKFASC